MSTTTLAQPRALARRRRGGVQNSRRWALWGSYLALGFFAFIYLVPPFYEVMTSLKSSAEISAQAGNPWVVHHPTLANFWYLLTYHNFQVYYLNTVIVTVLTVAISMVVAVLAA